MDDGSCAMARALGRPLAKIGYLVGTRRQYGLAHASECIELIHAGRPTLDAESKARPCAMSAICLS